MSYSAEAPFLAGDLALDFLNTAFGVGVERQETLRSDADVLAWLARAGLPHGPAQLVRRSGEGALLEAALALREAAARLVEKRKAGEVGNPAAINRVLALDSSRPQLVWKRGEAPAIERRATPDTAEALLVPIAAAFAELLSEANFDLVRECEGPACTLWFYDQTKSHRRRWCSMSACGNRAKVAAFRERQS
jgi:predicted RNA-binding Zn ribbon-like protein